MYLGTFNRADQEDPLKVFAYAIEIENFVRAGFSECSGLTPTTDIIEYREGNGPTTPLKSPGLTKFADLTLKRGRILAAGAGDEDFMLWYSQVYDAAARVPKSSGTFRRTIDILVFDKEGKVALRYRVRNAWPSSWTPIGDGLNATNSANMIESLTIAHEGFIIRR